MLSSNLIKPLKFDTGELPPEDQFEAWRAYNSSVIDVSLSPENRGGFAFSQQVWDLGKLAFTTSMMPGPLTPRSWQHLQKDPLDHWCLVLPESQAYTTRALQGSPSIHFRSLGRPFEGAAADTSVSTIFIPRDLLRPIAGALDAHAGTFHPPGLGGIFADFLIALERRLPEITQEEVPRLIEAICAMITACIAPSRDSIAEANEPINLTILERARQKIQSDLYSPGLGPDVLCRHLGISRSRLYALFEPLQGVAHYIQRQRLLAAHQALSDPNNRVSIQHLAEMLCFADLATFSRAFRRVLGQSPRDTRAGAHRMERLPPPLPATSHSPAALNDIGDVLRRLQV